MHVAYVYTCICKFVFVCVVCVGESACTHACIHTYIHVHYMHACNAHLQAGLFTVNMLVSTDGSTRRNLDPKP
jgi:hypothetical protein